MSTVIRFLKLLLLKENTYEKKIKKNDSDD
jgi:hypothetical protein